MSKADSIQKRGRKKGFELSQRMNMELEGLVKLTNIKKGKRSAYVRHLCLSQGV